jgi:multidrug efflux pump subunit AcrB
VLVTLGFFSIFQFEVNLTVIAALLTLVGFSVNDTIVIFDRIRENLRMHRRSTLYDVTNDSINQTLSRTIITSGLVFLSVLAMVIFGGEVLRGFSVALLIGIIFGTYSSVAIASPIMVWWQQRLDAGREQSGHGHARRRHGRARRPPAVARRAQHARERRREVDRKTRTKVARRARPPSGVSSTPRGRARSQFASQENLNEQRGACGIYIGVLSVNGRARGRVGAFRAG